MKTVSDVCRKWFLEPVLKTDMGGLKSISHQSERTKVKACKDANQPT
jgi:hypothetical protein